MHQPYRLRALVAASTCVDWYPLPLQTHGFEELNTEVMS